MGKLTKQELNVLREMSTYSYGHYFFCQATCKRLVEKGLAEPLRFSVKRPPHAITDAGRAALKEAVG